MIANVTVFKDHETLLYAWKEVVESNALSGYRPVLVLAGHLKEREHVKNLKVLAFDLGLGGSVRFLGPIDSTNALIYESDLVVHSSLTEGCPNAVCEAMALGKAVVGTDISGIRQALGDRNSELTLVGPREPKSLADAIVRLLASQQERERLGQANRRRIESEFSIEGMCEFFLSLFDEHLGGLPPEVPLRSPFAASSVPGSRT
jgi:glycosyltransferase involved in cell wall biosynthesis